MKRFISTLVTICSVFVTSAQTLNTVKFDSFIHSLSSKELAMGSLAISKKGNLYQKALGYSFINDQKKKVANIETRYRIGSISKMFTATMIFQLIDEGKINLDNTLSHYFPDLPNANKITIANLLYHRSGLHDYTHDTDFENWMDKPKTHEELLKIVKEKGVDFEPDTKADYCNTNYLILGYIIEKLGKGGYEDE